MTVFGGSASTTSVYLPQSSTSWSIGGLASKGSPSNTALLSFDVRDSELVDVRNCFSDTVHIFAFGRDLRTSVISVTLICFLGKKCSGGGDGLGDVSKLRNSYESQRISKGGTSPKTITIGSLSMKGFLVGMTVGNVDAQSSTCNVSFHFLPA